MREFDTSADAEIEIIIVFAKKNRLQSKVENLSAVESLEAVVLVAGDVKVAILPNRNLDLDLRRVAQRILQSRDHQGAFNLRLFDRVLLQNDLEPVETNTELFFRVLVGIFAERELHHGIGDRSRTPRVDWFEGERA